MPPLIALATTDHEFMSREGRVAGGGVLTQVIGWVAGGVRVGGSHSPRNVNTEFTETALHCSPAECEH